MKKHIITIAGRPGSGKSTAARQVATRLEYSHFSSGDLFRSIGSDLGIDVLQTNLNAEQNAEIDYLVDGRLRDIGAKEDKKVIDSRTAWHWIPNSFKVFLDLDLEIAAERILSSMSEERLASENVERDPKVYAKTLKRRLNSETGRYKSLYGIDPYMMSNYDLIINTATNSAEQTTKQILDGYTKWFKG